METTNNIAPIRQKILTKNTQAIIVVGIATILLVCACLGYFAFTLRDTDRLDKEMSYPKTVYVGDTFDLILYLRNKSRTDLEVQDIDLTTAGNGKDASILAGAIVTKTEPAMNHTAISSLDMFTYHFFRVLKPGETQTVVFKLRAEKPGEYHTDAFVYMSDASTIISDIVISIYP